MKTTFVSMILLFFATACKAQQSDSTQYSFQSIDWSRWHSVKLYDCNTDRSEYKAALLYLLKVGVERDTVERYIGKGDYRENQAKDKAYYTVSWECKTKKTIYAFCIHYKNNKIENVRRSIIYQCG